MKTREQLQAAIGNALRDIQFYNAEIPDTRTNTWFSLGGRIEPGNGGGYTFMVWRDMHNWYAAFPDFNVTVQVGILQERDTDYFREKARMHAGLSTPDTKVMVDIIRAVQKIEGEIRRNG